MKYDIAHELRLAYSQPVWEQHVELRLTPRQNEHQRVVAAELVVDPTCEPRSYLDCFGNRVHYCSLISPHDHLSVQVRARVDTVLTNPFDYAVVAPERERDWLADALRLQPRLWDFVLYRSAATPDLGRLSLADLSFPKRDASAPLLDSIMASLDWMQETIEYSPRFTHTPAKLEDALTQRAGACQDVAHLLIALVRSWGFAARYVMGYQDPDYGDDGEQQCHAWAEVLIPGAGWRGFDATTHLVANETYVAVAVGRDASDAAPIKSHFKGGDAEAATEVVVEVTRDQ